MRKQFLDALKAKFEGVSEQILGRIADKLVKTTTNADDVATIIEGVTFQQVLDSYGDSRATEAQQTAVRNYEQKYGLKEGKATKGGEPVEDKNTQPTPAKSEPKETDDSEVAKVLKAINKRLDTLEHEKVALSRKQKLTTIVSKLPEHLRKAYERTPVEALSDEDFDALTQEIASEVGVIDKDLQSRGAVFGQPNKGIKTPSVGTKEATDTETDAVVGKLI